ncbi:hypothetical protein LUZ60_002746 [Juncus effusus]|nr:hypothetical protein LUZ60_002746 [Juncus effusus]
MATKSSNEFHESETSSTRLIEKITGSHRFKVVDYSLQKGIGVGKYLSSSIFTVGGHGWTIEYYPDGDIENSKDHISFFLVLNSDTTDVKLRVNFTMLDQSGNPTALSRTTQPTTIQGKGSGWGYSKFIERKTFEMSNYLNNDSFVIMCTVTVLKQSFLESTKFEPVVVPPFNFGEQLSQFLESGTGADVTFEVNGEFFKAHKLVLAARSSVFKAQFFGPMIEKVAESIKLNEIEPGVFQVLLHFIYSDSIPEFDGTKLETMILYQHLLVAADRYEVERLKLICENELSKNIEVKNLATTLTLAEQHNCSALKKSCFNFVSSSEILEQLMKADGYEHMAKSCPNLLLELVENLNIKKQIFASSMHD